MEQTGSSFSDGELWRAWRLAVGQPEVDAALRELFQRMDAQVARAGPVCWASGRCCHFDAYGHRLYVTGLETAWTLTQLALAAAAQAQADIAEDSAANGRSLQTLRVLRVPAAEPDDPRGCPYQIEQRCSIHAVRPMGCRVFFCQRGAEEWQHDLYERFLGELKLLHDRYALPYRYMEWRGALAAGLKFQG